MEGDKPWWVMAQTLETIGVYDYNGTLKHSFTAHPKIDPKTGEMFFFGYNVTIQPYISYRIASKEGKLSPVVPIDIQRPVMMHDFAITENYAIFMDLPYLFDGKNIIHSGPILRFDKTLPCRFGILPRYSKDGKDIKWFDVKPCFVFHTGNAWEEGDSVIVIGCRHEDIDILNTNEWEKNKRPAVLYKWEFNLKTSEVTEQGLSEYGSEFPVINNEFMGRLSNFIYYAARVEDCDDLEFNAVIKYNVKTGDQIVKNLGKHRRGGEFVYVPKSDSAEDDGYLIGFVFDETKNNSEVVILSAVNLEVSCRIALPQRVPYGFHGGWLTREQLNNQRSS
eukprot:TRINITY_DN3630_c0_g1_i1.p1 TRINITY_DN3630_c0_g1~~TRINITY_DN3630_c0_g1_i1.p1  ORF type:complete len:335 (-),score=47.13 TRINITY_DN3630_c0_g1_i1:39-1043(-)